MEARKLVEVKNVVTAFFKDVLGKSIQGHFPGQTYGVTAILPEEKGWKVAIEVIEDPGMGMDPILGLYEVHVDEKLNIVAYERKNVRRSTELSTEKATIPKEGI